MFKGVDTHIEYILIDCPVHQIHYLSSVLKFATKVVIVTDLTHASLSMVGRLSKLLTRFVHIADVQLAINHVQPKSSYILTDDTFLECYPFNHHFVLPFCKSSINEAIDEGSIFADYDPDHAYHKVIKKLIEKDFIEPTARQGFLSSFLRNLFGGKK